MTPRRLEQAGHPPDGYGQHIHEKHMTLMGLVETAIMALLGWDGYPMDVSWHHWMDR